MTEKYKQHKSNESFQTVFKSFFNRISSIKYDELYSDIKIRMPKYLVDDWYTAPNYKAKYFMRL